MQNPFTEIELETIANAMDDYINYDDENLNTELLKGKNVKIITHKNSENNSSDEYFFSNSFIDLKNQNFYFLLSIKEL